MKTIDYETLIKNIEQMINVLEDQSSRAPGHAKNAASALVDLYALKDRYEQNTKKPVGRPRKED